VYRQCIYLGRSHATTLGEELPLVQITPTGSPRSPTKENDMWTNPQEQALRTLYHTLERSIQRALAQGMTYPEAKAHIVSRTGSSLWTTAFWRTLDKKYAA
jgi:hypothetical protein